jgi:signal transduction histidine kinase
MRELESHGDQREVQERKRGFFKELQIEFLIHELKDPLAVIETGLRMLLEKKGSFGDLTPKQERTLQRSLRAARKARAMLHGLLEIGRSEEGFFSWALFSPARTIREAILDALETMEVAAQEDLAEGKMTEEIIPRAGISLKLDPRVEEVAMFQDEAKFSQIVGNLVKNALHHRQNLVEVKATTDGIYLNMEVTDDGPGIEPEHRELIFRRYARLQQPTGITRRGHGLGLAGAKILAEALGGSLEVKSEKGGGATFTLTLPLKGRGEGPSP